jgi:phenylalanyl-tRNA synthetase beta chain
MELVYSWLKDYVDTDLSLVELGNALTMLGMEVEDVWLVGLPEPQVENAGITFHGLDWDPDKIVVGRVDEVMPHPNADRLVLCRLFDGEQEYSVLTGAPNLFPYKGKGQLESPLKVAYARKGATLYDGHKPGKVLATIKPMKIRGVESFSMICSEKELGISEEHEGVIILDANAPVGTPLVDYLGDAVFSIDIMPNTIHCSSVIGIAREVAAYLDKPLKMPDLALPTSGKPIDKMAQVKISDANMNPRFVAGMLSGVKAQPSPYKVQIRLRLAGLRPINSIVDATNYVMLETGEPLHAFDYDVLVKRAGGKTPTIITRSASKGETLTTLDDIERKLDDFTTLVCDTAGPLSIAGVMGGLESEVTEGTQNVLLEGASWNFINIRRTVASQRMHSEASYRFARNVHPALGETGVRLGLLRMASWSGGEIEDGLIDKYPKPYTDPLITVSEDDVERMLGIQLSAKEIAALLTRYEFSCKVKGSIIHAQSPPYRTDIGEGVVGRADVIEEVARLYGYDKIPSERLADDLPPQRGNRQEQRDRFFQDTLASLGFQEVVSYRLTNPNVENRLLSPGAQRTDTDYIRLKNPISEERNVMRRSMLNSVLEALERNIRNRDHLALFEIGPVFTPTKPGNLPDEEIRLGIALSGSRRQAAWDSKDHEEMDFFDLKGILEALLQSLNISDYHLKAGEHAAFHPGKCAKLIIGNEEVGVLGELHPQVKEKYSFREPAVLAADIDADKLYDMGSIDFEAAPVPAFPPVIEDLAVIVDESTTSAEIVSVMRKAGGFLLKDVEVFDIFRGDQIGAGRKSMAYRLTYLAPNRTLTDKDVGKLRNRIILKLEKELKAKIRKPE